MNMKNKEPIYHSNIFWHFCGKGKTENKSFKVLCDILKEKTLRRKLPQDVPPFEETLNDGEGNNTFTWQMQYICFADIPFAFLKNHIETYGNVGLGFKKEFIIAKGGQPALYAPYTEENGEQKYTTFSVSAIIEHWGKEWHKIITKYHIAPDEYRDLGWKIQALRKYIKQFSFTEKNCAYYEREWRVITSFRFRRKGCCCSYFSETLLLSALLTYTLIFLIQYQN